MSSDPSILSYIVNASLVVKVMMFILMAASIVSWTFIFQRATFLKQARRSAEDFEESFWSGIELSKLYSTLEQEQTPKGLSGIFYAGFKEFARLRQQSNTTQAAAIMEGTQRAMRVAFSKEMDQLENHLNFLATVGSIAPFVGLFGTVWGIMAVFQSLGAVQQLTIAMVAPGISEALVATAMGLFTAIPAMIAYNRYSNAAEKLANHYDIFQEEFSNILHRQAYAQKA